jgi:hypothetical protein
MTLELNCNPMILANSGIPSRNSVHLYNSDKVNFDIPMSDFCSLIEYALTNTDLFPNDPRLKLLERIKQATIIEGYNGPSTQRITL